jgi:hypothetical protein
LRWRLCEHRGGKQKESCEKTFHKRPSFRLTSSGATAFRGAHASGVLAIAFCDRQLCNASAIRVEFLIRQRFVAAECGDREFQSRRN